MKIKKFLLIDRTVKIALGGIIPSVLATELMVRYRKYQIAMAIIIVVNLIFFALLFKRLFHFRIKVPGKGKYYLYSLVPMCLYCGFVVAFSLALKFTSGDVNTHLNKIYTYLFFNFKSIHYFTMGKIHMLGFFSSAVCYSFVCVLFVTVFPFLINKKKIVNKRILKNKAKYIDVEP